MTELVQAIVPPNEDEVLAYTQGKRKALVEEMTKNNKFPDDKGDRMVLLSALGDMDRVALTTKRIKSDDKVNAANANQNALIASILKQVVPKSMQVLDQPRETPQLGSHITDPLVVDGETDIGTKALNYDSFNKKFEDTVKP